MKLTNHNIWDWPGTYFSNKAGYWIYAKNNSAVLVPHNNYNILNKRSLFELFDRHDVKLLCIDSEIFYYD